MSEYKIGTIRQPKGETVSTYTPSDAPEPAEEPAKPIEGDTPLPLDDPADDTEDEDD